MPAKHAIVRTLSVFFAMTALTAATPASAAEYKWGAIALDLAGLSQDSGYGIGGGDTEAEAKRYAQKFCAEDGARGCEVVTTYRQCGGVAIKPSGTGGTWGIGATKQEARANALTSCGQSSCKIVVVDCN